MLGKVYEGIINRLGGVFVLYVNRFLLAEEYSIVFKLLEKLLYDNISSLQVTKHITSAKEMIYAQETLKYL